MDIKNAEWLAVAFTCDDCGNTGKVEIYNQKPTEKDLQDLAREAGGHHCMTVKLAMLKRSENYDWTDPRPIGFDLVEP